MKITLQKAHFGDCILIHQMQITSFITLLEKYKDYDTNPAAETLEKIEQRMAQNIADYYFICLDNEKIGVIRVVRLKDICKISPMFVLPEYRGKGYAQQAILKVESIYPNAKRWELDTIKQESQLCHLYEKMGYKAIGEEKSIQDKMTFISYEKKHL